jgi:hypothetical protein
VNARQARQSGRAGSCAVIPAPEALARIAAVAAARVGECTLSYIAFIMQMTPRMLDEYLAGGAPEPKGKPRSFLKWKERAELLTDPHTRTCIDFISAAVATLPEDRKLPAAMAFLRELEVQWTSAVGVAPAWLQQLLTLCPGLER